MSECTVSIVSVERGLLNGLGVERRGVPTNKPTFAKKASEREGEGAVLTSCLNQSNDDRLRLCESTTHDWTNNRMPRVGLQARKGLITEDRSDLTALRRARTWLYTSQAQSHPHANLTRRLGLSHTRSTALCRSSWRANLTAGATKSDQAILFVNRSYSPEPVIGRQRGKTTIQTACFVP